MLMGIIQRPNLRVYFSRKHMLETPFFPNVTSEERFSLLTRFLHFVNNTNKEIAKRDPKLYKILPVSEYLKNKFQKVYIRGKDVSVDESLLLWKDRLSWKQYIPMKASQFGIKIFELFDSAGYLWNFIIYSGSGIKLGCEITKETYLFSTKVVLRLCEELLYSGRLKDQLLETFLLERKRQKAWYKKLFNHLVNTAVLNDYIQYCKAGNKKDHLLFRINLVNKIIAKSHGQNLEKRKGRPSDTDMECTRLTGQHFIQENPKTEI
ncbi:hypothetical protein B7P43_G15496 [Cryptotermes secundus]|uniref:PiggyBac transposable element-derived protein domain-containing protein n=1 Tax=Cryptotermes secundus TaxID=105785 RepID=A0A2J7R0H3_9NEOP|nr:hypothetical protein B7P43_G15496 [Cryptotermes secundus]